MRVKVNVLDACNTSAIPYVMKLSLELYSVESTLVWQRNMNVFFLNLTLKTIKELNGVPVHLIVGMQYGLRMMNCAR